MRSRSSSPAVTWHGKYLEPAKKLLVDLAATKTGLDTAIAFANEFFLALEARDHRVVIAPNSEQFHRAKVDERESPGKGHHRSDLWSPMRCTVAYIGTVAIGLTVIEMSEEAGGRYVNGKYVRLTDYVPKRRRRYALERGGTSTHDFPTGRLCLQAYSPYPRADWTQQWRETPARDLSGRMPAIVRELQKATVEIARLVEEGERRAEIERQRWEAQREQWRREEAARRAVKARKDSKEELLQIIDIWAVRGSRGMGRSLDGFFALNSPLPRRPQRLQIFDYTANLVRRKHSLEGGHRLTSRPVERIAPALADHARQHRIGMAPGMTLRTVRGGRQLAERIRAFPVGGALAIGAVTGSAVLPIDTGPVRMCFVLRLLCQDAGSNQRQYDTSTANHRKRRPTRFQVRPSSTLTCKPAAEPT